VTIQQVKGIKPSFTAQRKERWQVYMLGKPIEMAILRSNYGEMACLH